MDSAHKLYGRQKKRKRGQSIFARTREKGTVYFEKGTVYFEKGSLFRKGDSLFLGTGGMGTGSME